jgi:phage gp36-like protein
MANFLKIYEFKFSDPYIFDGSVIEVGGKMQLQKAYSTANPSILTRKSIPLTSINSFVPSVDTPSGTEIKYTLIKDGQDYYYNAGWVVSDGSYAKANTLAEIQAYLATFTTERTRVKVRIFLHSDGTATPSISNLALGFSYTGYCSPDDVRALLGGTGTSQNIDDEDIIGVIEVADSEVDTYLSKYTLPFSSTPAQIRSWSAIIAAYNLYSSFEVVEGTTKSPHRVRYEQAISELEAINSGKKRIVGLTQNYNKPVYSTNDSTIEFENDVTLQWDNYSD